VAKKIIATKTQRHDVTLRKKLCGPLRLGALVAKNGKIKPANE
jgi:hypothetical protein